MSHYKMVITLTGNTGTKWKIVFIGEESLTLELF